MNSGQTILTLCALALLVTINVNFLRSTSSNGAVILKAKCGLLAISLGESLIEEAAHKHFDEITGDTAISSLTVLTQPGSLGPDGGEVYPNFDDFDDYNNLSTKYFLTLPETLYAKCQVCYIDPANPSIASAVRTWSKKITVNVTSPSLKDTVKLSYIYSYWYFN